MLKIYEIAMDPKASLGRIVKEDEEVSSIFLRDREKVIFSSAFRRLEYKTQVFVNHEGDHYRNRLTHSLEVAAIAKHVARQLNLNEDLAETIALAHDVGHPPFGHAGEDGLQNVMQEFGGFDHNIHTIKVISMLERSESGHGLNLSYETIEGLIKHNGPIADETKAFKYSALFKDIDLKLNLQPTLEAQIASLADDIAYCAHDIEDGIRSGFFDIRCMMNIEAIKKAACDGNEKNLHTIVSNLRRIMIADLIETTLYNLEQNKIKTVDQIRHHKQAIACFSDVIAHDQKDIKDFLMIAVYRNYKINRMREKAKTIIRELFNKFMQAPDCLPPTWYQKIISDDKQSKAIVISDYIAGMTDRYAIEEYKKLFDPEC